MEIYVPLFWLCWLKQIAPCLNCTGERQTVKKIVGGDLDEVENVETDRICGVSVFEPV